MPRVLVVDDEFGISEALRDALDDEGYETDIANNGQDGLDQMTSFPPDLVILDFMMPVLDGGEVLKRMRADPKLAQVPVILITAAPRNLLEDAPGANAYLNKPFALERLLELVTELLAVPRG